MKFSVIISIILAFCFLCPENTPAVHDLSGELPFQLDELNLLLESQDGTTLENFLNFTDLTPAQKDYMKLKGEKWLERKSALMRDIEAADLFTSRPSTGKGVLRAGVGARVITPSRGCPLSGYGDRVKPIPFLYQPFVDPHYYSKIFKPSLGIHDDLWVKVVVLDNGANRVALIGIDSIGLTQHIFEEIVPIAETLGIPRSGLFLCGSHSHSGFGDAASEILWWIATADVFDARIFDPLKQKLVEALTEAVNNLQPASLGMGFTYDDIEISHNRRDDEGIYDTQVSVIKIDREPYGDPLAVLFNYAVHPTCLGGDNMLFSGDNAGFAERYIEGQMGGAMAVFFNGAEGDVAPNGMGQPDDWSRAQAVGEALGERVLEICSGITTDIEVGLASAHQFVDLPDPYMRPGLFEEIIPVWIVVNLKGLAEQENTNFNAIVINNTIMCTIPGEPITQIGWAVKDHALEAGFDDPIVFGLGNGHIGYITTEEEYWQGGYESGATLHGPETGAIIVQSCNALIDELASP